MTLHVKSRSPWMSFATPERPALDADAHADVCVIGAGIAGMTSAYLLAKKGYRALVIDDGPVGHGMTSLTTAHLMTAIDDRYYEIERLHGEDGARLAYRSHAAAIDAIEAIVAHEGLECDFERLDGYLFLPPDGDPAALVREYEAGLRAGVEGLAWADRAPIDALDTGRCLRFPRQGQFHPLKYVGGLARAFEELGGRIHSHAHAVEVHGGEHPRVVTAAGARIGCDAIVVATNSPISDRFAVHTKQAPYTTFAVALRVPRGSVAKALLWDTLDAYHYVRLKDAEGEVLIVGGEDHKTGQARDSETRFARLELWARERFPMAREVLHRWSGQVMETIDDLAYIGRDPGADNVYVITGDSGMGMTHGTLGGIIVTELVHGSDIAWAHLYDPKRKNLKAASTYARENANVTWQYADWIKPGEVGSEDDILPGTGAVMRRGLQKIAIYRDEAGALHEMSARCTHLGCAVRWNAQDATWDCPCHGSRFDAFGEVINGPAIAGLPAVESSGAPPVKPSQPPLDTRPGTSV
ncbi:MAG TPA: FAD-dependent oxidoreductase [Usitatibacter sp.]|jgi:glycine/D-amino acid oxidase-like deaminating enzyme/nitrite reductase/ring-hydroxylating ferredoxin subunit|nr:FAD-dependent oxidoreductase [Usitatibacter sp.]